MAGVLLATMVLPLAHSQSGGNADLDRVRGEIIKLRKRLENVRKQARTAEQEVEASDLELGIRTHELDVALQLQADVDRQRAGVEAEVALLLPRIARQKEYLAGRLVALYRLGSLSYVRLLLSLEDQRDPSAALSMLSFLVSHDARVIDRFQEAREYLRIRELQLIERKRELVAATQIVEERRRAVAAAKAENERLLARLRREESGSEAQLAELEEKARRLERLVDLLAKQSEGVIAATGITGFKGALAWPVEGKVLEAFGRQRNPKFATYTMNNGLKIAATARAPVRSIFQGTVLFSQWFKGYGNLIILDHGNRVFSLYGNVIGPAVTPGERVATGQAIAGVGESEDAESAYLYFEIRHDNRPEDPAEWLR
ncbi:MAG TPA: peptidoglycan DD-metalloendopeptidase family protein [Thermoanaerobaculia bacterium]|nr:peptidoglycan DD-metalloendopeptidase family protein [Thermoanaerobaculia bacterium]